MSVIPSGFRVERLRAEKRGAFTSKELQKYCLQTRTSLEVTSSNTPQQIGMSERIGKLSQAMARCMLADSGLPKLLWGELMFTTAVLENRAPHSAIGLQPQHKLLHGTEPDLRLLRVTGARTFVRTKRYSQKLNLKAVEGV